jgi:hypothetical protein
MRRSHLLLWLPLLASAAAAQTPAFGPEVVLNASTASHQTNPAVAAGWGGDFIVAWQGVGEQEDIFARFFDTNAAPLTGEFRVNTYTSYRQRHPSIASNSFAHFVVVWDSDHQEAEPAPGVPGGSGVYGQRFNGSVPQGAEFHVNTTVENFQFQPAVSHNGSDFVVCWQGSGGGPYHQRFAFDGTPQGQEFETPSPHPGGRTDVALTAFGFVVVWNEGYDRDGSGYGIFGQVFDGAGLPRGSAFQVNTYTTGRQAFPKAAHNADGFVVVWVSEGQDGSGDGVFARRFNYLGAAVGDEIPVTTRTAGSQGYPDVASDFGNFVVVWSESSGMFGQRFDSRGRRDGGEFQVDDATSAAQSYPAVSLSQSSSGNFVVAWQRSGGDGDGYGVIGRRLELRMARPMRVDEPASASLVTRPSASNGNGVLEPGESAAVEPAWANTLMTGTTVVTGMATSFAGPAGGAYALDDDNADYGSIDQNATADCRTATGNCYRMTVSGSPRPATHWDATFRETLDVGFSKDWSLHVGGSFTDVPATNPFYRKIETLLHTGITAGCSPTAYCPGQTVSRGQMSLFVARAIGGHPTAIPTRGSVGGQAYDCRPAGTSLFSDVEPSDIICRSVHYIAARNVTLGCATGKYCPEDPVTRTQMAAFVAKAIPPPPQTTIVPVVYGPDPVTGRSYDCRQESESTFFTDVPATDPFCKHVHLLWARGIIAGCGGTLYCGSDPVTREAMAKFLSNAFELQLYGP